MKIKMQIISMMIFSIFITSCATVRIKEASRTTVYPGVRDAKVYLNYEVLLSSKKEVEVKEVYLGNKKIDTFYLQNMTTLKYEKEKKVKGLYKLSFKLPKSSEANSNDLLKVIITKKGKSKTLTTSILTKKAIHKR